MEQEEPKAVDIIWQSDEGKTPQFSNQLTVSFDGSAYYVRFYYTTPPVNLVGHPERISELSELNAYHVLTLAVPEKAYETMVDVLARTLEMTKDR